jgi:glycosyltransferase involved in cell wall biosynthesis
MIYKKKPLVSICIPTYNAERTIEDTLGSILNQTYKNLEIIISENASKDNTFTLLNKFNDPRIRIYKNNKTISGEKNWSKCIELASGEFTAIFHADDMYMPDMVEKQVKSFLDNPSIGAVFTTATYINENDEKIGESKFPHILKGKKIYDFTDIFFASLRNGTFLMCPSAMVRSDLYKELNPFNYEQFRTSADLDMWLRILEKHPIVIIQERLLNYRISKSQGSYTLGYLYTEKSDFLKTMDHYLSVKSGNLNIPSDILDSYEIKRSFDNLLRAVNHLIKDEPQDAKKLIEGSLTLKVFPASMEYTEKLKFSIYCIFGIIFLILIYLGLSSYLGKGLHWFLYSRKQRI